MSSASSCIWICNGRPAKERELDLRHSSGTTVVEELDLRHSSGTTVVDGPDLDLSLPARSRVIHFGRRCIR
jgi:hypothetical protein